MSLRCPGADCLTDSALVSTGKVVEEDRCSNENGITLYIAAPVNAAEHAPATLGDVNENEGIRCECVEGRRVFAVPYRPENYSIDQSTVVSLLR